MSRPAWHGPGTYLRQLVIRCSVNSTSAVPWIPKEGQEVQGRVQASGEAGGGVHPMATGRGVNRKRKGKEWRGDGEIRAIAALAPSGSPATPQR